MKNIILSILKGIWWVVRLVLIFVGSLGMVPAAIFLLICIGGFFLIWLISGWGAAIDIMLLPVLVSVGILLGFSFARALGMFQPE